MAANLTGQIEPYDLKKGEEWARYIERLQQFFIAKKITEVEWKVVVLLTVIDSKVHSLL